MYKFPLRYLAIVRGFKGSHKGIDFGWNSKQDGMNAPIYASADGVVYATNDYDKSGKSWGNYVKIKHNETEYTLYAHMRDGLNVKLGQNVKQGDLLGYMGNTGDSQGNHLHFEFYKGGAGTNYRVNALDYVYAYPDQVIHPDDVSLIKKYVPTPILQGVERNTKTDQIKVLASELRVRSSYSTDSSIVAVTTQNGFYNWYETQKDNSYTWYRIGDNQWIANDGTWVEELKKEETKPVEPVIDEKDVLIANLQKENQELKDKLELERKANESHQKQVEELNQELETLKSDISKYQKQLSNLENELNNTKSYKKEILINESGKYKILVDLLEGETLIIK